MNTMFNFIKKIKSAILGLLGGAARILDIGAVYDCHDDSPVNVTEADCRAIANDWLAVGNDLRNAMNKFNGNGGFRK